MKKTFFKEEQYFSNPGLWIFVAVVFTIALAPTILALYSQLALSKPLGDSSMSSSGLVILLVLFVLMFIGTILLFRMMKLVTEVNSEGFWYSYPPFILKSRSILIDEIDRYEIRKYKPITEYSGWGIRYSWAKSGRAFNVKGNIGLQLYLKDGKKILFGTQRPDALLRAMHKLMK